jgi:transcriptional regulator with XRE-family HTH domain
MSKKETSVQGKIIWENVKRLSDDKGWDKKTLAKHATTTVQTLYNIQEGKRGVGPALQARLAEALDVSVGRLLSKEIRIKDLDPRSSHILEMIASLTEEDKESLFKAARMLKYDNETVGTLVRDVIEVLYKKFEALKTMKDGEKHGKKK